jgi:hypothetical protein
MLNISPYRFGMTDYYSLTKMPTTRENLTNFFYGDKRQGLVCGECRDGCSAYFHSRDMFCGENKYCGIGMLFFLLSEIIPITVFFVLVIAFGISFSSGALNIALLF